jgi:chromosome segregation ATPase
LTEENQIRLKRILSLLDRDMNTVAQDVDQIRDLIELIDQRIPTNLRAVLEFGNYSFAIKRANKNISAKVALLSDKVLNKQKAKDLHSRIQTAKTSLAILQPELKTMKDQEAELEAQLAQLRSKIQAHEDKIANVPESIDAAKKEIAVIIEEGQQLKMKLTDIQDSEEDDQKLLADVDKIKTDAVNAIKHCLEL